MIIKCIKEMELGELAGFLCDGGFCPEKYDASVALEDGEEMEPFFGAEKAEGSPGELCEAGIGSPLCRECIEEFLQEECKDEG